MQSNLRGEQNRKERESKEGLGKMGERKGKGEKSCANANFTKCHQTTGLDIDIRVILRFLIRFFRVTSLDPRVIREN